MLLNFCKIFDIASGNRWPIYHIQSLISYFVGLGVTHIALFFMRRAQPALLYIVPCLLISTIATGLFRRELKELYRGDRIQALFDGTDSSDDDENDSNRPNTNAEQPSDDIIISIIEPTRTDHE